MKEAIIKRQPVIVLGKDGASHNGDRFPRKVIEVPIVLPPDRQLALSGFSHNHTGEHVSPVTQDDIFTAQDHPTSKVTTHVFECHG